MFIAISLLFSLMIISVNAAEVPQQETQTVVKFLDLIKKQKFGSTKASFTYDDNGNRLTEKREYTDYLHDLQLENRHNFESKYTYDFNTNEVTETWTEISKTTSGLTDKDTGTTVYTFNKSGAILTVLLTSSKGYSKDVIYIYNSEGKLLASEETTTSPDGASSQNSATYDANKNIISSDNTSTQSDGSWDKIQTTETYDSIWFFNIRHL